MNKNIYENLYSDQKNIGDLAKNIRIQKMLAEINKLNLHGANILDIGCYDGSFLSLIKNRNNNFFGLEASNWGFEQCRKKNIEVQKYFFDDKSNLPYEDNFFDVVAAGEIIEHIYDTDFFLQEISRVLKSNGKLLISTPNLASFGRRLFLLLGKNPHIELSPNEPTSVGHIRYFTFKTLEDLLKKNNFKVCHSQSDCINFSRDGLIKSTFLAKLFPKFGASIIMLAAKM